MRTHKCQCWICSDACCLGHIIYNTLLFQPTCPRHFGRMSLFLEPIFVFCFKITFSHASIIFKCINAYWLHAIFTIHTVHPWHFLFITYAFLYEYITEYVMKMSQPVKGGISKYTLMLALFAPFREVNWPRAFKYYPLYRRRVVEPDTSIDHRNVLISILPKLVLWEIFSSRKFKLITKYELILFCFIFKFGTNC